MKNKIRRRNVAGFYLDSMTVISKGHRAAHRWGNLNYER
jgi:hypothetical protein